MWEGLIMDDYQEPGELSRFIIICDEAMVASQADARGRSHDKPEADGQVELERYNNFVIQNTDNENTARRENGDTWSAAFVSSLQTFVAV